MFVLVGSIIAGMVGVVAARQYARGPQQTHGLLNPARWQFATKGVAEASLEMESPVARKSLITLKRGYSNMNMTDGFKLVISHKSGTADGVAIRNVLDFEKDKTTRDLQFSFAGAAPQPFPITFVIRDSMVKKGGGVIWSQAFTVSGDWKEYSAIVPASKLAGGQLQYLVVAGHLGGQEGTVSLRQIYLK